MSMESPADTEPYYDRQGNPIGFPEWAALYAEHTWIARHRFRSLIVSTIWVGIDMRSNSEQPPLIFETVVFVRRKRDSNKPWRTNIIYPTEAMARAGHQRLVSQIRSRGVAILGRKPWPWVWPTEADAW